MYRVNHWCRPGIGRLFFIVLMALAALAARPAGAQDADGSLVIYAYACPEGFTGTDYIGCRDNPLGGVIFTAFTTGQQNGIGATSDSNGWLSFALGGLAPGEVNAAPAPVTGFGSFVAVCSGEYVVSETGVALQNVEEDNFITCEWYFLDDDGEPTRTPVVTRLPNTGSGAVEESHRLSAGVALLTAAVLLGASGIGAWRRRVRR